MSKNEMSEFGKAIFDTFGALATAQAELAKAQQRMGEISVKISEELRRNNEMLYGPEQPKSAVDELAKHNPELEL